MKKTIGIYYNSKFNESSFETGCGGSETWLIQIAKEFVRKGYHVIIFNDGNSWEISQNLVEYVPISLFKFRCEHQHFDYFIMTRLLDENVYDTVVSTGCKNIFLQSHDMFIWYEHLYDKQYKYNPERFPYIKKYIALTDFHKWELETYNNIPEDKIEIIGNGLDSDVFTKVEKEPYLKTNHSMLFPSVYTRGGNILVEHVLPYILQEIPDFEIHLCGYSNIFPDNAQNNPHVKILGMLSKEDYYREFMKHKVWFLPCTVPEDFGLCACEAIMCGCEVVSTFKHGMKDVLWPFEGMRMENDFKTKDTGWYHCSRFELDMSESDFRKACQEAASLIVNKIKYYDNPERKIMRDVQKKFVTKTYTWDNIVNKWIKMFKICENED